MTFIPAVEPLRRGVAHLIAALQALGIGLLTVVVAWFLARGAGAVTALLAGAWLGLSPWASLLVAAVLVPTDPVLAAGATTGRRAAGGDPSLDLRLGEHVVRRVQGMVVRRSG